MFYCTILRRGQWVKFTLKAPTDHQALASARKRLFARYLWTPDTYSLRVRPV